MVDLRDGGACCVCGVHTWAVEWFGSRPYCLCWGCRPRFRRPRRLRHFTGPGVASFSEPCPPDCAECAKGEPSQWLPTPRGIPAPRGILTDLIGDDGEVIGTVRPFPWGDGLLEADPR